MEWIVGTLVVLGFIAIVVRFVARDDAGRARLPRMVDDSIGMWAFRRLTGRPLWEQTDDGAMPTRQFVISASRLEALGIRPAGRTAGRGSTTRLYRPARVRVSTTRRPQAASPESVAMQRRLAAIAAVLVVAFVALVIVLAPRSPRGGVLGSTGGPAAITGTPPPVASISCTTSSLTVDCDGGDSARTVTYKFDFEGGPTGSAGPDPTASYTYSVAGTYAVTLTVADEFGRTSTDSATVTLP